MTFVAGFAQFSRPSRMLVCAASVALLAACGSTPRAPVYDRSSGSVSVPRVDPATLPGHEFAGKPGYYTVQPGETVRSIARANNMDWRDLVNWNSQWVPNPNQIEVGQVLRIQPPAGAARSPVTTTPPRPRPSAPNPGAGKPADVAPAASEPAVSTPAAISMAWPVAGGGIIAPFDGVNNKGISISGKEGDAVNAAADGKVIYAGSALRGYGNLLMLQHTGGLLTVYAHNSRLLVKEDQHVKKGQKIAEMGKSDADRVKLHFEVRRNGKPVNPAGYLPPR